MNKTEMLKLAAAHKIRLSAQADHFALRIDGHRLVLSSTDALDMLTAALGAQRLRLNALEAVSDWADDFVYKAQQAELNNCPHCDASVGHYQDCPMGIQDPSDEDRRLNDMEDDFDPISAARRYHTNPEYCSAADEDAAWFMMTSRGGF